MSTENVTWAPHFCVLVLFWVPNILQCRESKLWGSTLISKKEKKEHLGWKRWWFKLCLLFCISQSRIFIQCPILFWILLYPKNCPNRDAWDWVPSKNLWCSFENQAIIVMCTPGDIVPQARGHNSKATCPTMDVSYAANGIHLVVLRRVCQGFNWQTLFCAYVRTVGHNSPQVLNHS